MSGHLQRASRYLSLILRHDPDRAGIHLDSAGWVSVEELLPALDNQGHSIDRACLAKIVEENDKKRFEFSEDSLRIRARQGHSVEVALGYQLCAPPESLFHGTGESILGAIREKGLLKMDRHAVHLSADIDTAMRVGGRKGKSVVLKVRAKKLHGAGQGFFLTGNGVWCTEHVPSEYLLFPGDEGYEGFS